MPAATRGRTAAEGGQLELAWVPPATPATSDFVCWLWAAFPASGQGRLDVRRIAAALGISQTTVRRWVAQNSPKLGDAEFLRIRRRAILRGRGHYLWPDLDPVSRRRSELLSETAALNHELITTEPDRIPGAWRENGTLDPHEVHLVWFPRAHVFGVSATRHPKAKAKVARFGEILETVTVPNLYAAMMLKHQVLGRVDEHRCVTPRQLVPTGRTETWRELGGPTALRQPLQVHVVRFAGLRADHQVTQAIVAAYPDPARVQVEEQVVGTAEEACTALVAPADVVILASSGYTRATWGRRTRRRWPGGRWYAGGRGTDAPGMSFDELTARVRELGGLRAPLVVFAADRAAVARTQLRRQLLEPAGEPPSDGHTRLLLQVAARRGAPQIAELVELIGHADHHRDEPHLMPDGLTRHVPA